MRKYRIDSEKSTLDVATIREEKLGLNIHEKNGKSVRRIKNHHQLAKLYMQQFMAKFDKITDGETDASAILNIIGNARCFSDSEREGSHEVRSKVRNIWGHCNYKDWTEEKFLQCFHIMEKFTKNLSDTFIGRSNLQAKLAEWQENGIKLLGPYVDPNLLKKLFEEFKVLSKFIQESSDSVDTAQFRELEERVGLASQTFDRLKQRVETVEQEQISLKTKLEDHSSKIQKLTEKDQSRQSISSSSSSSMYEIPNQHQHFTGREEELLKLRESLASAGPQFLAISGLGGVGL